MGYPDKLFRGRKFEVIERSFVYFLFGKAQVEQTLSSDQHWLVFQQQIIVTKRERTVNKV